MEATSVVQNLLPQQNSNQSVTLNDGQMIYGKVNKIHSNQTAEISIGQTKITAKLDAPIAVGERYWFQVQNTGEVTALKVLDNNGSSQNVKEMSQHLLQHLSLSQTKESLALAQFYVKNQIPVTKDQFVKALQMVNESGNIEQSMKIMKILHSLSLPITSETFKSIEAFENRVSLQSVFKELLQSLGTDKSETENTLKAVLEHLASTNLEKMAEKSLQKIISTWLSAEGPVKNQLYKALQNLGLFSNQTSQNAVYLQALNLIGDKTSLVRSPDINQAIQLIIQLMKNNSQQVQLSASQQSEKLLNSEEMMRETVISLTKLFNDRLTTTTKNSLENIMWKQLFQELRGINAQKASINVQQSQTNTSAVTQAPGAEKQGNVPISSSIVKMMNHILAFINAKNTDFIHSKSILELFSLAGGKTGNFETARNNVSNMLMQLVDDKQEANYISSDRKLLQTILQEEVSTLRLPQATILTNDMKSVLRTFGLGFENYLSNLDQGVVIDENELLTLKPLLLKLLSETHNPNARDYAEQLLHKITAQQMLSQSSGPIQHLLLNFPISFHRFQTEVTMHFSGRKKNDGEIDPSFCRVLFYLQLDNINETVIDMVVQNKIMKVTIINEHATILKSISSPFLSEVKERLENVGYQMSAISFELPNKIGSSASKLNRNTTIYETTGYNEVDLKI